MYPEKVTYYNKYNLRPIVDRDGQFSAEDANHLKEKVNKNALFHDVHDNLAALQLKFPNPPVGAFAYLRDGSCYRCVSVGWTTDSAGSGSEGTSYFYGYHLSFDALKAAHPKGKPGARAIIRVQNGNDLEALWDEDDQDWFLFQFSGSGDTGGSSITEITYQSLNWQGAFAYEPFFKWTKNNAPFSDSRAIVLSDPHATYDRYDLFAVDLTLNQVIVIEGIPSENPAYPEIDPVTQLAGPFVSVKAGSSAPEGVTGEVVYAEGAEGEWEIPSTVGSYFNLASPNNPFSGAVCIETVQPLQNGQSIIFNAPVAIPSAGKEISYRIKNKAGGAHQWLIVGTKSNGRVGNEWISAPANYDPSSAAYQAQSIFIPSTQLVEITSIRLVAGFTGFQYHLDDVRIVGGSTPAPTGDYVTPSQLETAKQEAIAESKAYADSLVVGGADNVHDSYNTMDEMIAFQGDQLDGEYFVVIDASGHSTVDAGWAFFEYLGTTLGTEDDYRKLSEQESLDIVHYDYSQDIADVQAEVDALEQRVADLEAAGSGGTGGGGIGSIDFGLTGAIDGTNKVFQTSAPFTAGKVLIFLNGIAQTLGDDYTESTTQIIEFIEAPHVGDKLIALY